MKKYIGLFLAMLVLICLAAPYLAIAEANAQPPDTPAESVAVEPAETQTQTTVAYTTGADPPRTVVDLTPLLQAVLSLAVSLITAFLIPWIRAKYSVEQRQRIEAAYRTVVYAAEQIYGAGAGEKKLQWAIDQLMAKGFTVDRALLEEQVKRMTDFAPSILDEPKTATSTAPPATT